MRLRTDIHHNSQHISCFGIDTKYIRGVMREYIENKSGEWANIYAINSLIVAQGQMLPNRLVI